MFSKACEYGIRASIFIAKNSFEGNRVSPKEISEKINSPQAFTAKILQDLVRHKIIKSVKGAHGGFEIDKDEISKINDALVVRWSRISFEDAAGLSHLEKWLLYFRSVRIVEKMVLLFSLSSAIYLVFKSIFTKKDMIFSFLLATTLIIQIYFVPDLRFFAGTLVAVVYLLFFNNLNKSSILQRTYIIKTVVAVEIVLSLLLYSHLASSFGYSNGNVLIKKAIYPREKLKTISIDETKFYVPTENEYCWNKIPCILNENPNLHLLGPKFKDGFYQKEEAAY